MKAVILAGGAGARIGEDAYLMPKPMIEIGGKPFLWHVMKIYSHYGITDFVICIGHQGYMVKEYFANYFLHMSDVTFDMVGNQMEVHQNSAEPWRVTIVDTGPDAQTGGRLKRVGKYLDDQSFCFTYGDGVANIDIAAQLACHRAHGKLATVMAIQPPGRFGALDINAGRATNVQEKPAGDGIWRNGGFFVLEPDAIRYIEGDQTRWEAGPLTQLAAIGELVPYQHRGFWQPMDTLRDKVHLEALWKGDSAPWKVWQ